MKKILIFGFALSCSLSLAAMDKLSKKDLITLSKNCSILNDCLYQAPELFYPRNKEDVINCCLDNTKNILDENKIKHPNYKQLNSNDASNWLYKLKKEVQDNLLTKK